MGSLKSSSRPTYKPTPTTVASSPVTSVNEVDENSETEQAKKIVRRASRGRGSTIKTSFRGVLGEKNSLVPQRKNLLGE